MTFSANYPHYKYCFYYIQLFGTKKNFGFSRKFSPGHQNCQSNPVVRVSSEFLSQFSISEEISNRDSFLSLQSRSDLPSTDLKAKTFNDDINIIFQLRVRGVLYRSFIQRNHHFCGDSNTEHTRFITLVGELTAIYATFASVN